MGLRLKPGAQVRGLSPEMVLGVVIARDVYAEEKFECRITSGSDGQHSEGSLHYKGDAVDLGIHGIPPDRIDILHKRLQANLGDEFQVLAENLGTPNQHFHVQFKPLRP